MNIKAISDIERLLPYRHWWQQRSDGCPFRSWAWLTTWWKHYGRGHELFVLVAFENDREEPVGLLPTYIERSLTRGKVLRLLGDGEVCSEHLDLLTSDEVLQDVSSALADFLAAHAGDWDCFQLQTLSSVRYIGRLIGELSSRGCPIHQTEGLNCWTIQLPSRWDDFLAMQSKSHRKQLRQLKSRVLESSRANWITVDEASQFEAAWESLIDLHQRRRQSLGEPGCFASDRWANFHHDVAHELLLLGQLRLSILELDKKPIAAEYHLVDRNATYAYQGGIDPDRRIEEPGQLSMILCIQRAIAERRTRFELLRGDEPYKPHWRAEPTATANIDIISPRATARWRHYSWRSAHNAARFVRSYAMAHD